MSGAGIRCALLAVPMRFMTRGNVVPGRLLGVFMTDANKEAAGAAHLILALRPKRADSSFCDSASPTSANHLPWAWRARSDCGISGSPHT